MTSVALDDARLSTREAGAGDALILVHDAGFNADVWDAVLPLLAEDRRVIAYDRRGFGRSDGAAALPGRHFATHGTDLAALVEALAAGPADVLGWGTGAFVALHAALERPATFRSLVLYEPPFLARRHFSPGLLRTRILMQLAEWSGHPEVAVTRFLRLCLSYDDGSNSMNTLAPALRVGIRRDAPAALAELHAGTGEELASSEMRVRMRVPVSILLAEASPPIFLRSMKRMTAALPDPPVLLLPNTNHLAHVDDPAVFAEVVRKALDA
jgi:pimeloyl-ACP methyl ester carboxylesterase